MFYDQQWTAIGLSINMDASDEAANVEVAHNESADDASNVQVRFLHIAHIH